MNKLVMTAVVAAAMTAIPSAATAESNGPTCSGFGWATHGQHIVGDYVSGLGSFSLDWPPSGQEIGEAVSDNGGAVLPGGPGPSAHFGAKVPPGASFCTDSNSGEALYGD